MSDDPPVRPAEAGDEERVQEIAKASTTTSYDLSPRERDELLAAVFGEDAQAEARDGDDAALFVGEVDGEVAGVALTSRSAPDGVVQWLHVHPDHRGHGVGTALFERAQEDAAEHTSEEPRVEVADSNREGAGFVERFDLERVDEGQAEVGGIDLRVRRYGPRGEGGGPTDERQEEAEDIDVPDTVEVDGQTVYLLNEQLPGADGPFVPAYTDEDRSEAYGYYCTNCDSLDVAMDSMDAIECDECGNAHRPEEYDGAYL